MAIAGTTGEAPTLTGHEISHGLIQNEAGLVYWDEPGALNESYADVFGTLVKQFVNKQKFSEADWLIGSKAFTEAITGSGLRSLRSPGTAYNDPIVGRDQQPDHMSKFVVTNLDSGGVHINSGIPSRAFYLVAELLQDSFAAGRIWYDTLCDKLKSRSNFADAVACTTKVAQEKHGANSKEHRAVKKAWKAVGL